MQQTNKLAMAKEFFEALQITPLKLNSVKTNCPSCNKLKKTYCLKCGELLVKEQLPQVKLPIDLLVLHHEKERHQKSSALPLQFLSDQIKVHSYPPIANFEKGDYILYPSDDARLVSELTKEELKEMKRIVAIDCTWLQTKGIMREVVGQKFIRLNDYKTIFWRYQHQGDECLATVEAIYYFYKEYLGQVGEKCGNVDDLLFFYKFAYEQIGDEQVYERMEDSKKRKKQKKLDGKKQGEKD